MEATNNQQMHKIRKKVQKRPTLLGRASTHPRDLMLGCPQAYGDQPLPTSCCHRESVSRAFRNKFFTSINAIWCTVHHTRQSQKLNLSQGWLFWSVCFKVENIFVNREDINTKICFKNLFNC